MLDGRIIQDLGSVVAVLAGGAFGVNKIRSDVADLKDQIRDIVREQNRSEGRIDLLYLWIGAKRTEDEEGSGANSVSNTGGISNKSTP